MFSVAGVSQQSGFMDGAAGSALFNNPSGIVALDSLSVLVCDYGNHALRLLRREEAHSNRWHVSTLAGQADTSGETDGVAEEIALLQWPYQVVGLPTVSEMDETYKDFYFTEHGAPHHAVRCYRHYPTQPEMSEVFTVHRGAPFVHLQGLCVGTHGDILVCDSGAGCIWSIDVTTKQVTKKVTSEYMFEASSVLMKNQFVEGSKPCTRFMPTTITHMAHIQPGYYLIASQDSPHLLFKYFDAELTSSFRNTLSTLHSEVCDGKMTLVHQASTFLQNTESAKQAVIGLNYLIDDVKQSVRESLYRRQMLTVQSLQVSLTSLTPPPFNSFLSVCMLANSPDMESLCGLVCKLLEETRKPRGRRGGHLGMSGRQRAQAHGLRDEERIGLTHYDNAFDDFDLDRPRHGFSSSSSGDSEELKSRLIEVMESYNFSAPHLDCVKVQHALFEICKVMGADRAGNMFQAVLRNQRYYLK
jgi:hypothetical protein